MIWNLIPLVRRVLLTLSVLSAGPEFSPPPTSSSEKPSNLAVATLICGITAWLFLPWIGSMMGLILGMIELSNIKKGKSPAAGKTITQVGFYLSIAQLVLTFVGGCVLVAMYMGLFAVVAGAIGLEALTQ